MPTGFIYIAKNWFSRNLKLSDALQVEGQNRHAKTLGVPGLILLKV